MVTVNFILNGKPVSAEADGLTLLKYLRGVACLKGAKEGCSTGHCGACTVLLDGKPVRSCVTRMDKLEGKSVVTIEALHGADGGLHPIQQAFLDIGAVQCGFCTPGMVLATKALLDVNPDPTDEEICEALKNLFTEDAHIFGTDEYGRDVFARIIHGARVSLSIGILATSCSAVIGGLLGAVAAFYGKKRDFIIMRCMDIISSIPSILLAMAVVAALGANLTNLLIALSFSSIATYARLVRSSVVTLVGQEFIEAARACGASNFKIIVKHIIPNSLSPIICQMAFSSSGMILTAASMSYLGLGIQPPNPEWGAMLASAKTYIWSYPYLITIPGICIVLAALSITLIGDGLRDALDPKLKD